MQGRGCGVSDRSELRYAAVLPGRQLLGQAVQMAREIKTDVGAIVVGHNVRHLADELGEAKRQAAVQNSGRAKATAAAAVAPASASDGVAEALNAVAARIEKITQTI